MESEGVSGTSGTLAQEVVSGYATKHRGLKMDLLPTPLVTEVEHRARTEALKAKGVSFHSRENGESRPNGLMDYLRFFDMLPTPTARDEKNRYQTQMTCRHKFIKKMYAELLCDMEICKMEGWDILEYPRMMRDAIQVCFPKKPVQLKLAL